MGNSDYSVVSPQEIEQTYWAAKSSDDILGLSDIYACGEVIAYDVESNLAKHVVEIHNEWWDKRVWLSYQNNLAVTSWYDHLDDDPDGW